jgi:adenylate cyclase
MLKTQITVVTLLMVALHALAIRPLYPLVVAAGGICVHGALLVFVLSDPRTIVSSDFVDSMMGPALSVELVLVSMLIIAIIGAAMGYLTLIARRTVVQGVRLEVANAHLGRYFSPGVVSRISSDADTLLGVGGRTQEVAVMFCDIRDFTTITENLPPSDVVEFLSQYHTCMVEVIFGFGGTIDKFIGDAIMVTFGTPDPSDDDAERSVRAGLAMNTALADLNADRERRSLAKIRHGIGIHFGPVIAGNIGTENRLEYTVIGDTVNVASRIQDVCKSVGEAFLISDAVKARLPPDIQVQSLPEQRVKGRQAPVRIYAVQEQVSSD